MWTSAGRGSRASTAARTSQGASAASVPLATLRMGGSAGVWEAQEGAGGALGLFGGLWGGFGGFAGAVGWFGGCLWCGLGAGGAPGQRGSRLWWVGGLRGSLGRLGGLWGRLGGGLGWFGGSAWDLRALPYCDVRGGLGWSSGGSRALWSVWGGSVAPKAPPPFPSRPGRVRRGLPRLRGGPELPQHFWGTPLHPPRALPGTLHPPPPQQRVRTPPHAPQNPGDRIRSLHAPPKSGGGSS